MSNALNFHSSPYNPHHRGFAAKKQIPISNATFSAMKKYILLLAAIGTLVAAFFTHKFYESGEKFTIYWDLRRGEDLSLSLSSKELNHVLSETGWFRSSSLASLQSPKATDEYGRIILPEGTLHSGLTDKSKKDQYDTALRLVGAKRTISSMLLLLGFALMAGFGMTFLFKD